MRKIPVFTVRYHLVFASSSVAADLSSPLHYSVVDCSTIQASKLFFSGGNTCDAIFSDGTVE